MHQISIVSSFSPFSYPFSVSFSSSHPRRRFFDVVHRLRQMALLAVVVVVVVVMRVCVWSVGYGFRIHERKLSPESNNNP